MGLKETFRGLRAKIRTGFGEPLEEQQEREVTNHTFRFNDRRVKAVLISCGHSTNQDTEFILENLAKLSPQETTLFVEQGSPYQKDHINYQLKLIADRSPAIASDFKQKSESQDPRHVVERSVFDDEVFSPFGTAANFWLNRNGSVLNMDLAANISPKVTRSLVSLSSPEFAIEQVYYQVLLACYSKDTIPMVLKEIFPMLPFKFILEQNDHLYPIYSDINSMFNRRDKIRKRSNSIRDKYMTNFLIEQLKEGDIVLAHPTHIRNIIKLASAKN